MARTGRPPKPIEVKRRTGNPGRRALPSQTTAIVPIASDVGIPPVPMKLGPAGRGAWETVWQGGQSWLSPRIDIIRVETVCRIIDEIADLQEIIANLGRILVEPIVTPLGMVVGERLVPNPAVKMLRDAEKQLDRELSACGFDPTSRSHLGLTQVKKQSILERLYGGQVQEAIAAEADIIDIAPDG